MTPIKLTEQLLMAFDTEKEAQEQIKIQQNFDKISRNLFEYEIRPENYSEKETEIRGIRTVYRVIKHSIEKI